MSTALDLKPIRIQINLDQCLRLFSDTKKRVITVALVTERIDKYNTIINPEGCVTDFRNVVVDFRHSRISTGARLTNKRVENVTLDTGEIVRALLGDIEVFEDSQLRLRDPQTGQTRDDGNAYQAIDNGRILSVSVDFAPIKESIWKNEITGTIEYKRWSLNCLSMLDIPAGQEDSFILNIRSLNTMSTEPTTPQEGNTEIVAPDTQINPETQKTTTDETQRASQTVPKKDEAESPTEEAAETPEEEKKEEMDLPSLHKRMLDHSTRLANCERMLSDLTNKKRDEAEDPESDTTRSDNTKNTNKELTPNEVEAITNHLRTLKIEPNQLEGEPATQFEDDQPQNGGVSTERAMTTDEYQRFLAKQSFKNL